MSGSEKNKIVLGEHRSILSKGPKEDQGVPACGQDRKGQTQNTLPTRDPRKSDPRVAMEKSRTKVQRDPAQNMKNICGFARSSQANTFYKNP